MNRSDLELQDMKVEKRNQLDAQLALLLDANPEDKALLRCSWRQEAYDVRNLGHRKGYAA